MLRPSKRNSFDSYANKFNFVYAYSSLGRQRDVDHLLSRLLTSLRKQFFDYQKFCNFQIALWKTEKANELNLKTRQKFPHKTR